MCNTFIFSKGMSISGKGGGREKSGGMGFQTVYGRKSPVLGKVTSSKDELRMGQVMIRQLVTCLNKHINYL